MKNWTIRHRIVASIAGILLIILAVGILSLIELRSIGVAGTVLQRDSVPGLESSSELLATWLMSHSLTEKHALLQDASKSRVIAELRTSIEQTAARIKEYEPTIYLDENRVLFEKFKDLYAEYALTQQQIVGNTGSAVTQTDREVLTGELAERFRTVRGALAQLVQFDHKNAKASVVEIMRRVTTAGSIIIVSLISAVLLASISGVFLLRSITRPLTDLVGTTDRVSRGDLSQRIELARRDEFGALAGAFDRMVAELSELITQVQKSAIQVGTSVTEIVATANEQQATATEIAATTTQIGATSKEISATSKELVSSMHEVSTVAEQTASLASSGQAGMTRMEATMRQVTEAAASINAKLVTLNERAGNINQVVTTITKVADQTNLLSLNAAIEAEKAGEAGRGFAVVATEIRRLADQTSVATYDIEQTVKEIQSAVAAGVMGMDKFSEEVRRGMQDIHQVGDHLSQIIQHVQALAPRCAAASEGMQAQSTGAEQISDALAQLSDASQQTVDSLRQSNDAIGGLNGVANALRAAISRFKLRALPQSTAA